MAQVAVLLLVVVALVPPAQCPHSLGLSTTMLNMIGNRLPRLASISYKAYQRKDSSARPKYIKQTREIRETQNSKRCDL
jgi:hypothetical protein